MTDPIREQIRILRWETPAAVQQRQALADEARSALITALERRLVCRPGVKDALAVWDLDPLPQRWTVSADAQLSYTRSHTDDAQAHAQARFGVPDEIRQLDPAVAVYPQRVIEVTPLPAGNDPPTVRWYRITVQVRLHVWATASRSADAHHAARTAMQAHLPALAAAGIVLTGLTWLADSPDDSAVSQSSSAGQSTADDDLAAATAERAAAFDALVGLRRKIRARAIRALVDAEFDGPYQPSARRVDRFLTGLGLDALPRAHHITVVVELTLLVVARTVEQACDAASQVMRAVTSTGLGAAWEAYGGAESDYATGEHGRWRVPWRHEYETWLRGHATSADAGAAAHAAVRVALHHTLAGLAHELMTVTATVHTAGIDQFLDPESD
ncbi:hypothetical protein AB0875_26570 [Micromonospora gifhornensis]|uniref:hypothetical protein n=1 Tax=Micromonospora gifhornensis TaxID=84594 RepID=UPI003452EF49